MSDPNRPGLIEPPEKRRTWVAFAGGWRVALKTTREEYHEMLRRFADNVTVNLNIPDDLRRLSIATAQIAYVDSEWFDPVGEEAKK